MIWKENIFFRKKVIVTEYAALINLFTRYQDEHVSFIILYNVISEK